MDQANNYLEKTKSRLDSIDQFRGFAILLMVLANYLSRIQSVPAWLKNAPLVAGLTVVDLIAPFSERIQHVEPWLTLHGLRIVFEKNRP